MPEKKHNIHKTLLILLLVFIPPYWLLFTDEGARVSDTALLWLLGEEDIKVSIQDLDSGFSRQDIEQVFSENTWTCGAKDTTLGDSVCATKIGTFNGFPSRLLTFYFRDGQVSAMKLNYRDQYHRQIMGHYIGELGQPNNVAEAIAEGPEADSVLQWQLPRGTLVLKKELAEPDEPALLWLAAKLDP
jgi:hypothetical protein